MVRPASIHRNSLLPGVECLLADLSDSSKLAPVISQAAAVIYCAGSVRGRQLDDFRAANIDGVRSVVDAMNLAGASVPFLFDFIPRGKPAACFGLCQQQISR